MGIKKENQKVILDAWYTGFGACKLGYQTDFRYRDITEEDRANNPQIPDGQEKMIDYIEYQGPWAKRIKSTDVFRDPKRPPGEDRIIWLHFDKTLDDLLESDIYEIDDDFRAKYSKKDPREVEINFYEGWSRTRDGLFIIGLVEGFPDPIRYEKSSWLGDGFPIDFLDLAEINDEYYPPAYLQVAAQPQKQINYMATLQGAVIDKFRNQTGINVNALTENGKRQLKDNDLGGQVDFKEPPSPHVAPITSAPIPADLFNVMNIMQDSLQEILQVSGLRMGSAEESDTLGQDKIKEFGNQLGITGMQDKIKDFVTSQATKIKQLRQQYSTGPELVPIVGMNIINPVTGKPVNQEWLEFGTPGNPTTLRQTIAGDYGADVDIKSAQKPNEAVQLQMYEKMLTLLPNYEAVLADGGWKLDMAEAIKKWFEMYRELVPSLTNVLQEMTPQEKEQLAQRRAELRAQEEAAVQRDAEKAALDDASKAIDIRKKAEEVPEGEIPERV